MSPTPAAESALKWLRDHAPTPSDGHEAVALAVHAVLLHYDFRPSNAAATETQGGENAGGSETTPGNNILPSGWGGAGYGGQYRHVRSAMLFDIRAVRMGGRLVVHAVAGEDDTRLNTVDVRVCNFYNPEAGGGESHDVWDKLTDMNGLATLVAVQIAHRLVPDGSKHGYEHGENTTEQQTQSDSQAAGTGSGAGTAGPTPTPVPGPRPFPRPYPRDDQNDPLRIGPVRDPRFPLINTQPPPPFGHDDLIPAGLPRPGFPDGRFGIPNNQGGNLMGPNAFHNNPNNRHRTPPGVPPGARFDPYGVNPDPDAEFLPGFEDDHRLRNGGPSGGPSRMFPPRGGGAGGGGDDGPPPGMFF